MNISYFWRTPIAATEAEIAQICTVRRGVDTNKGGGRSGRGLAVALASRGRAER